MLLLDIIVGWLPTRVGALHQAGAGCCTLLEVEVGVQDSTGCCILAWVLHWLHNGMGGVCSSMRAGGGAGVIRVVIFTTLVDMVTGQAGAGCRMLVWTVGIRHTRVGRVQCTNNLQSRSEK